MSFYPLLLEAKQYPERNAVHKKMQEKFPKKYIPHKSGNERFKNAKNVPLSEFRKDIEDTADELGFEVLQTQIVPPGTSDPRAKSDSFETVHVKLKDHQQNDFGLVLTPLSGNRKTSTDFKEGMVCFFFDSDKEYEPFSKRGENVEEVYAPLLEEIIKDIERNGISGVEAKAVKEILDFLKNELLEYNSGTLDAIFNAMSIGNFLRNHPNLGGWTIHRDQIFNDLKKEGKKITGYPEDKWCPMDIVLVKPGNESEVKSNLSGITSDGSKESQLGKLNGMFIDTLDSKNPDSLLAAISLKEEEARAGHAKSYVDNLEVPKGIEYNLTEEEKNWIGDNEKIKKEITEIRKRIKSIIDNNLSDIFDYKSKPENFDKFAEGIEDRANYLGKYGSLKMLLFFLEEAKRNKNVFEELASYGLSLGVNPTFYKLIGNKEGDPERVEDHIEVFERSGGVEIYHSPGKGYDNKIWIIDNNKASNVKLIYWVLFASWIYVVHIYIRTNQPKTKVSQVVVEIDKFEKYKDLTK